MEINNTIKNSTENEATFFVHSVVSAVVCCFLLVIVSYLVTSLCVYERLVKRKNKESMHLTRSRSQSRLVKDKVSDHMRWLCLAGSSFLLVRLVCELVEIFGRTSSVCQVIRPTKAVFQAAIVTCIYLVLWLRQRKFYQLPVMEQLVNKYVRFLSGAILFIMVIADVGTVVLYSFTRLYKLSHRGCIVDWSTVWTKLPGLFLFLSTVSFQAILLGLLIFPLYKHRKAMKDVSNSSNKDILLMRRVTIAAVATVASDSICGLLSITALTKAYSVFRPLLYDIGMMVALGCVLVSFVDWRNRLIPFLVETNSVSGTVKRVLVSRTTETEITTVT